MKNIGITILILLISNQILGQEIPKVVSPAPNAASLMKYVEMPVSYATGIPNISIPIYNVSLGQISLPINLSYHAGGIRVEETASWVGLGWSLNAGGVVSRNTRGLPDDTPSDGYMYTSKTVEDLAQRISNSLLNPNGYDATFYTDIVSSINGTIDYEPDLFSFNFGANSGKFAYDQENGAFFQMPYSNITITPIKTDSVITGWVFTTPDGFKYYLGKSQDGNRNGVDVNSSAITYSHDENGLSVPSSGATIPSHITSWYLMDVVSPNGDHVKFYYDTQNGVTNFVKTSEDFILDCGLGGGSGSYSASFSESIVNQTVIDRIEFGKGSMYFIEDTSNRSDLSNSKALKNIEVKYDGQIIKKFNLSHDYTISAIETGRWTNLGNVNQRRYRLRLLAVQEEGKNGVALPPYNFEYENIALPSRFSNAQDYWGFYNGMNSNSSLIPQTFISGLQIYTGDANRTVDTVNSKAGILKKVIYPTGGNATYYFQSNTASSVTSENSGYNLRNRGSSNHVSFTKIAANWNGNEYTKTFTVGSGIIGRVSINSTVSGCNNNLTDIACDYNLSITGISDPNFSLLIGSINVLTSIPAGTYKIVANPLGLNSDSTDFTVLINWKEDPHPSYLNVGGQRVEKIILENATGGTLEKNLKYDYFDQNLSSGMIISSPTFLNTRFFNGTCNSGTQYVEKITSYSLAPSVFVKGNVMAYSNVTEILSDKAKTEYTFDLPGDISHTSVSAGENGSIHLPDVYSGWLRGNLIKKEDFEYKKNNYTSIRTLVSEYEQVSTHSIHNFGLKVLPTIGGDVTTFNYGFYSGISEWFRLKKNITTNTFDSKNLVIEEEFFYENNPLLASTIITSNTDGQSLIKKTYYPSDVISFDSLGFDNLTSVELNAIYDLKTANRITTPIQNETYKDINKNGAADSNELIGVQRSLFVKNNGLTLPERIQTTKKNNLEDRIVYHSYDSKGNPLEVSEGDGTHIYYVWGYNQTQPIAKLENFTSSEANSITAQIQAAVVASNQDNDNCRAENCKEHILRVALKNLRDAASSAMVTTFTYDPLIGVTSITDPKGQTVYYEYDAFNRLKSIRDSQGNLVQGHKYHYKNQ